MSDIDEQAAKEVAAAIKQIESLKILPGYRHAYISAFANGAYYQRQQPQQKEQFSRDEACKFAEWIEENSRGRRKFDGKWLLLSGKYGTTDQLLTEYLNSKTKPI